MGEVTALVGTRPNYATFLDQDKAARENRCLAEAIYFEARGESDEGQAAVAQVVLESRGERSLSGHDLRRRLSEPAALAWMPILFRL